MTQLLEATAEFSPPTGKPQIFHCEQLSETWWQLRRGIPTASKFGMILTPAKGLPSSQQDDYIAELISERAEFRPPYVLPSGGYVNDEMAEGIRREPEARAWYAMQVEADVKLVGFVLSACGRFGCSPDGLVGEVGGLELKNPSPKQHVKYLAKRGSLTADYRCQVHGLLIVTGREWIDAVSYCPGFPPVMERVKPDEFTEKLRAELECFCDRYRVMLEQIKAL